MHRNRRKANQLLRTAKGMRELCKVERPTMDRFAAEIHKPRSRLLFSSWIFWIISMLYVIATDRCTLMGKVQKLCTFLFPESKQQVCGKFPTTSLHRLLLFSEIMFKQMTMSPNSSPTISTKNLVYCIDVGKTIFITIDDGIYKTLVSRKYVTSEKFSD